MNSLVKRLFNSRGYVFSVFLLLSVLLLLAAEIQKKIVEATLYRQINAQLDDEAKHLLEQIDYRDQWQLSGYRNQPQDFSAPSIYYYVMNNAGAIADIEGKPPRFHHVRLIQDLAFNIPTTVTTQFNESWRLLRKPISGGWVVVGAWLRSTTNQREVSAIDENLSKQVAAFTQLSDRAIQAFSRELPPNIDYGVVSDEGDYLGGTGGIPIKLDVTQKVSTPERYVISKPILGPSGQVGSIVLAKDVSIELATVQELANYNRLFAAIIAVLSLILGAIFLLPYIRRRSKTISIDDAIRVGEGKHIEFKSTFQCCVGSPQKVVEKRLDILKAIAGFLNGDGGTLFIGIMEQPPAPPFVRGLPEDMEVANHSADEMRRTLVAVIADKIGRQFSDFVTDHIEERDGKLCWVINVSRSAEPAFVTWKNSGKEQKHFYVREGPRTADLDLENTWRYIRNRWRK